jgi:curli biogenesis system outer membrane secretion channel CsgG
MKVAGTALAVATLGIAACSAPAATTVIETQPPAISPTAHPAASSVKPVPTVPKTVTSDETAPAAQTPASTPATPVAAPSSAPPAGTPQPVPNVTDPWAVVAAYYGDIESGDYAQAWALLNSGMTTGQTYQQFVSGFACTGAQDLSENWESGDEVNFDLAATNDCTGAIQYFAGTDTVVGGKIVAADVSATG